jgi:hypothetical protein
VPPGNYTLNLEDSGHTLVSHSIDLRYRGEYEGKIVVTR